MASAGPSASTAFRTPAMSSRKARKLAAVRASTPESTAAVRWGSAPSTASDMDTDPPWPPPVPPSLSAASRSFAIAVSPMPRVGLFATRLNAASSLGLARRRR